MRLTTVILIATLMQVSAAGLAQKITLSKSNASLKSIFREIKSQSGYNFIYTDDQLERAKNVSINVKQVALEEALKEIFKNQELSYSIDSKTVIVKSKAPSFLEKIVERFQEIDVSGRVVDALSGEGLPGANVKVKGMDRVASTDKDGNFSLQDVNEDAVLEISYIGYITKTVKAVNDVGTIRLEMATSDLQEVTINKGYYTEQKRLSTGNIGRITAKEIEHQPVQNALSALQGRVAGLEITQQTGVPGGNFQVRIRGTNSIANGNDPLYIIDGVPFISSSTAFYQTSAGIYGLGISPLNSINPSDIQSIEVLKDADATAIYGSRGSNGVILITTKQGQAGKTKVDANFYSGAANVSRKLDLLDRRQYLDIRREAFSNDGITPTTANAPDLTVWDTTRYTNWQKELIGGTAHINDGQFSISGGDKNTQFSVGAGLHKETTVFPGDNSDQRVSTRVSLTNTSLDEKLKTSISLNYSVGTSDLLSQDLTSRALSLSPNAPALYDEKGELSWKNWNLNFENPLAYLDRRYESTTNNLVGNAIIGYKILANLEIKSSFGYTNNITKATNMTPVSSLDPETATSSQNTTVFSGSDFKNWIIEPQLNWKSKLGKNRFDILAGTTFLNQTTEGLAQTAVGFASEALMKNIGAATTRTLATNYYSQYRHQAIFGRINYSLNDKYIVNLTGRRDGSSRFGPGKQFANFGAAGVAWIFSEEDQIKDNLTFLSFGKLRTSYGVTGNDQLGDYQYLDAYTIAGTGYYQSGSGLTPARLSNPDFAWETNRKLEVGLELGFVSNRILSSFSYYNNRSSNQLVGYPLPTTTGFTVIQGNFPATVQNTGLEIELNTKNIDKPTFTWNSSFNITIPKNKLVAFPNLQNFPAYSNQYVVGEPLSIAKLYHYTGLDATKGLYSFQDLDVNGSIGLADQQLVKFLGKKFYGGLSNTFMYKGLQLDVFFQFMKQTGYDRLSGTPGSVASNQNISVLNRWKQEGDNSSVPKASTIAGNLSNLYAQSDNAITDASFIRLRNVSLSYSFNNSLMQKVRLQSLRMFLRAQNLLTITHYKNGLDPEGMNSDALPPLRTVTFGVHLTF